MDIQAPPGGFDDVEWRILRTLQWRTRASHVTSVIDVARRETDDDEVVCSAIDHLLDVGALESLGDGFVDVPPRGDADDVDGYPGTLISQAGLISEVEIWRAALGVLEYARQRPGRSWAGAACRRALVSDGHAEPAAIVAIRRLRAGGVLEHLGRAVYRSTELVFVGDPDDYLNERGNSDIEV